MNRERDSKPLIESSEESADVRSLLVLGARDEIDYDFDRGLSQHLGAIGALPVPPQAGLPGAAAAKATTSLSAKALLLLIGAPVATAAAAVALWLGATSREPRAEPVGVTQAPRKVERPAVAERTTTEEASPSGQEGAVRGREMDAPPKSTARPSRAVSRAPEGSAHVSPYPIVELAEEHDESSPAMGSSSVMPAPTPPRSEARGEPNGSPRSVVAAAADRAEEQASEEAARKRAASAAEASRRKDERLEREMAALVEAKRALADDPGRALLLARQGERDFSHGVFSEERQHILILALIQLGRLDEARRTAAPYLEQHPDSPFARRVRAALDAATRSPH